MTAAEARHEGAAPLLADLQHSLETHFLTKLEYLNAIGIALSQERDIDKLLETILVAAKNLTRADGGTLYRLIDDKLRFEIMMNDSLKISMGGTSGNPVPFYPIPLHDKDGNPNRTMIAAYAALNDRTVNIADAYTEEGFDFSGTRNFDKRTGYRSTSFLTVPMKNHEGEIIGVLQLLNAIDAATGAEAIVIGPANAARVDLERLALRKLLRQLGKISEEENDEKPVPSGRGRIV